LRKTIKLFPLLKSCNEEENSSEIIGLIPTKFFDGGFSMAQEPQDVLVRMNEELQRALEKAPEDRRWVMVIDLRKCVGCHACTIACVAENKLPPGVVYRPVLEKEIGTYPNVKRQFIPRPCMQCDNPPCVPVCPVNATYSNAEGVVVVDYEQCIGCNCWLSIWCCDRTSRLAGKRAAALLPGVIDGGWHRSADLPVRLVLPQQGRK